MVGGILLSKTKKSVQAIIVTVAVGLIVPKLFSLSNIEIFNKIAWKAILGGAFGLATLFVGFLYSIGAIRKRSSGGKARIATYLVMVVLVCMAVPALSLIFSVVSEFVRIIIWFLISTFMFIVISKIITTISKSLKNSKSSQSVKNEKMEERSNAQFSLLPVVRPVQLPEKNSTKVISNETIETRKEYIEPLSECENGLKTIFELWEDKDPNDKCITITNDENPDLKWVKIYKPCYGDGFFYGYIKMQNAHETVNGKIYFGDRPIWYVT